MEDAQQVPTVTVADLRGEWQQALDERRACGCKVCQQPDDVRVFIDDRVRELTAGGSSNSGRHGAGLKFFADRVTKPKLNISLSRLTNHRDACWTAPCSFYPENGDGG